MRAAGEARFPRSERFDFKGRLGAGAMGVVYRAYDHAHRVDVALKTLRSLDGASLYRFKNEFRSLSGIVHGNLVTLYELQSADDEWFFTMELVEGRSFLEHVRPHEHLLPAARPGDLDATPELGPETAVTAPIIRSSSASQVRRQCITAAVLHRDRLRPALAQLTRGLDALHRAGKLHRDIKPSNVLVDREGRVVVCDFGLVAETVPTRGQPRDHNFAGTPVYMSPEQALGDRLQPASDWYSLGVMLYEALTGRLPHTGELEQLLEQKRTVAPAPPRRWDETIDPALNDLCLALLHREPSSRPSANEILDALGRPLASTAPRRPAPPQHDTPFVGRSAQRAALSAALEDVRRGGSAGVLVHGPSGMGKSALLRRFLEDASESSELILLEGRCYERESVPYKALDGLVDALSNVLLQLPAADAAALIPPDIGSLARLFPVLRRIDALHDALEHSPLPHDPQDLRLRAFGALRHMLGRLAQQRPTIVFIDDLQWGDIDSAFFLEELLYRRHATSLLFIGSYRSDGGESSPLLQVLLHRGAPAGLPGDVREVAVDPLSRKESRQLALAVLGANTKAATRTADEIAREAGGHPFFVIELARAAEHRGASASVGRLNLDDVLRRRITDLPEEARALLTAASVAGRPTALSVVSRAAGINDKPSALAILHANHLARTYGAGEQEEIEPFHDRIRGVATTRLSAIDLRRMHRRLARALESSRRDDPQVLVEHWLGAGVPERAAIYAIRAARQAEDTFAFDRAAHHYRLALELDPGDDEERRDMQIRLADALANSGNLAEAAETYLQAAEGAEHEVAADLRRRALKQLLRSGRNEQGLALAREVLRDVGLKLPLSHPVAMISVVISRARLALRGIEFEPRPADEIRDEDRRRLDLFWSIGSGFSLIDPLLGTAFQMRNLMAALKVGDPYHAAIALSMEIGYRSYAGGRARESVMNLMDSTRQLAEQTQSPRALSVCLATSALARFSMGDFEEAHRGFEHAEHALTDHGVGERWDIDVCRIYRMSALWYLGRIEELKRTVVTLLHEAVEVGDQFLARGLRAGRANAAWLALDAPDEARRQAELAQVHRRGRAFHLPHFYELFSHCQIDLYAGDGHEAWRRLDAAWRPLKRSMLVRRAESIRISAYYLRARCALAAARDAARPAERDRYLRAALVAARQLEHERNHWNLAKAAAVRGSVAVQRGELDAAVAELGAAMERFRATDMSLHAMVVQRRLGALLGGDEGAALGATADAWMGAEGIVAPERMADLILPVG